MAWYGHHVESTKKLDQLLEQQPSLSQLLQYPQFIEQSKSYNPKLLDYLGNTDSIIQQLIDYITIPPKESDSDSRKYKLPTLSIQLIESDIAVVLNWFFKQSPQNGKTFMSILFSQLLDKKNHCENDSHVLPLLAGYFLRANVCFINFKYKDAVDFIYQNGHFLHQVIENCESYSLSNILQVYLNLDLTKVPQSNPSNLKLKIDLLQSMFSTLGKNIQKEQENKTPNSTHSPSQYLCQVRVENLSSIVIEILEKYYLMTDGREMADFILLKPESIQVLLKNILKAKNQTSLSMLNILISALKHYSFSSFNTEQPHKAEQNKKNQERLETQPLLEKFIEIFPQIVIELSKCQHLTVYHSKLIELINMAITLNSFRVFDCVKKFRYIETLIELIFRFENCNLIGTSIEKLFVFIFRTERTINEDYRRYIFCEAKIIDLTADRYLSMVGTTNQEIEKSMSYSYRRKPYFGHLMKIMKIYSGVQTTNQEIINAIQQKSLTWNHISRMVLKPYEAVSFKELGKYDNIPENSPIQYSIKSIVSSNDSLNTPKEVDNTKLIEEINRQESMKGLKSLEGSTSSLQKIEMDNHLPSVAGGISSAAYQTQGEAASSKKQEQKKGSSSNANDDQFFKPPRVSSQFQSPRGSIEISESQSQQRQSSEFSEENPSNTRSQSVRSDLSTENSNVALEKKSQSYSEFLEKQKAKAETEIKKERSRSKERQLSKGKARMTSPSPSRRVNKWGTSNQNSADNQEEKKDRVSLTAASASSGADKKPPGAIDSKNMPKIPHHKKGLNVSSSISQKQKQDPNKSMEVEKTQDLQSSGVSHKYSKSMVDMNELKKVKIIYQFEAPAKKQYRKIDEDDKAIFDLLGIAYQ